MCIYLVENFIVDRIKRFSYINVTRSAKLGHNLHINFSAFLNQAYAGHRLGHTWFLKTVSIWMFVFVFVCACVCLYVCPPPRLLITSGVICTPYDWLNKFYSCIWQL